MPIDPVSGQMPSSPRRLTPEEQFEAINRVTGEKLLQFIAPSADDFLPQQPQLPPTPTLKAAQREVLSDLMFSLTPEKQRAVANVFGVQSPNRIQWEGIVNTTLVQLLKQVREKAFKAQYHITSPQRYSLSDYPQDALHEMLRRIPDLSVNDFAAYVQEFFGEYKAGILSSRTMSVLDANGINDMTQLIARAKEGNLQALDGVGPKIEKEILDALQAFDLLRG